MAIQKNTLMAGIKKSAEQLDKGNVKGATATLERLKERMTSQKEAAPRKPSQYGLYVKDNFPKMKAKFPTLSAPQILGKIAEEWKKTKKAA